MQPTNSRHFRIYTRHAGNHDVTAQTKREAERVYQFECGGGKHRPCKHRKRETRDGVEMEWCYAIGCVEIGDMPCEYCADRKEKHKEFPDAQEA